MGLGLEQPEGHRGRRYLAALLGRKLEVTEVRAHLVSSR